LELDDDQAVEDADVRVDAARGPAEREQGGIPSRHQVDRARSAHLTLLLEAGAEGLGRLAQSGRAVAAGPGGLGLVEFVDGPEAEGLGALDGGHGTSLLGSPRMHDLSCVVHLHSVHSDGTGTVEEIAKAAEGIDVVLLTDHDTMAAEPGWYGDVLVLVGEEVSPKG